MVAGGMEVVDELGAVYQSAVPEARPGEAFRLFQGNRHELFEMELETERLAAMAAAMPAVAEALRRGVRSVEELRGSADGQTFVTALEVFLQHHGHLGQSSDDLALPSWSEAPDRILDELAKRIDAPRPDASERQHRLRREADDLAAAARKRLADRPEDLARFDRVLDAARRVAPLSETHNYWIDRAVQARLHSLAVRVGRRLVRDGVLETPSDVFYLRRSEVGDLLRAPTDVSPLVADRRATHERQRQIVPAPMIGAAPASAATNAATKAPSNAPGSPHEPGPDGVLHGTGASSGTARGRARVVRDSSEFGRIMPGDIIVCQTSNPSWVPVFAIAGGLVTNIGGMLSHAAVVAREFGLPAVVGVRGATEMIADGQELEIDGTAGVVRRL